MVNGVFADLHIHSRFSRACSKDITIENLEKWARVKGIGLLGTGDFTHPLWLKELKEKLIEKDGILYSKSGFKFLLTGEISLMYTQGRGRRVHLVLLVPNFETADKINEYLDTKGRRDYDGRPIFKISCEQFVKDMREISEDIEVIPAHGMSSDPEMNWHLSELNSRAIVSFSDSHSFWPWRIGREATIFEKADSYQDILNSIRENKIIGTIETEPGYGKYHWDGHMDCNFSSSPEESKKINGICPVCGKSLTIGVANRVNEIQDQIIEENRNRKKYYTLLPLHELIAFSKGSTLSSKKTWEIYNKIIEKFENEFNILLNVSKEDLIRELKDDLKLVQLILDNREGKIKVKPGYDGKYGELIEGEKQKKLF
jgi:PHP family Zn ribbon phosphoesterase